MTFPLPSHEAETIKERMLSWSQQFSILSFLDSNSYPSIYDGYECLLAVGAHEWVSPAVDMLAEVQQLHNKRQDWLFGHICYDYKNALEPKLTSTHSRKYDFPLLSFFIPETVCHVNRQLTELVIESFSDPQLIYSSIIGAAGLRSDPLPVLRFTKVIERSGYIDVINRLREHIAAGDCYEINYCNEGFCNDVTLDPLAVFRKLNKKSPAPFAAYYRHGSNYLMCASPERYLYKQGRRIVSQPIKGTARRHKDVAADEQAKAALRSDVKEQAENVMIVDLVRNDLSRTCEVASISVDELFGIYTFPQVHQMISTVSGRLRDDVPFTDTIRHSFPMGSMTGAPKHKVMQLIDKYEQSARELFSGAVGYISPSGDFDFNVVIRSLFYNSATRYLSYQTGGAITYDSVPEKEWDELQLKAWALEQLFS